MESSDTDMKNWFNQQDKWIVKRNPLRLMVGGINAKPGTAICSPYLSETIQPMLPVRVGMGVT